MSDVCVCMFYVCEVTGFVDWLDRVFIYICEKSLEMCICLWPEFECPEVTLCGWQDIKIQLLLSWNALLHNIYIMMMCAIHSNQHFNTMKFKSLTASELLPILDIKVIQLCIYINESYVYCQNRKLYRHDKGFSSLNIQNQLVDHWHYWCVWGGG